MATKIILHVEGDLSTQDKDDLNFLLADALAGFAVARCDARAYVERNYPGVDFDAERETKIEQVRRRVQLARRLHNSVLSFKVLT